MLRYVEADRHGCRIPITDFEVDVGYRRVKRVLVGVCHVVVRRNGTRRRKGDWTSRTRARAGRETGKYDHNAHALLKAWRIRRERKNGSRGAIANQAHPGPHVNGTRERVTPFLDKYDAFACRSNRLVDGSLQCSRTVAVPCRRVEIDSLGIVE